MANFCLILLNFFWYYVKMATLLLVVSKGCLTYLLWLSIYHAWGELEIRIGLGWATFCLGTALWDIFGVFLETYYYLVFAWGLDQILLRDPFFENIALGGDFQDYFCLRRPILTTLLLGGAIGQDIYRWWWDLKEYCRHWTHLEKNNVEMQTIV